MDQNRREFLSFLGRTAVATGVLNVLPSLAQELRAQVDYKFTPLAPSSEDKLLLAPGFKYDVLIRWNDKINFKGERFGFNNDFIAFIPENKNEAYLWVNHETTHALFVHGKIIAERSKAQIIEEQKTVGGSILKIKKVREGWEVVRSRQSRRIDATTPIKFSKGENIRGHTHAIGTLGNCGGGLTPWKTFLSCEENYDQFYGETKDGKWIDKACVNGWEKHFPRPPEHYGWVVEITPHTGEARKHTAMGRFAHEAALVVPTSDGRVAVYMGDDANDQHIYKFISTKPNDLSEGDLYVAHAESGEWRLINYERVAALRKTFSSQLDVMIRAREAAKIVGATPYDRPEDIKRDPLTGAIIVALTNNKPAGRPHGQLLKLEEKDNNPLSLNFKTSTFKMGGEATGFSCPDNLVFDRKGNLWVTVDMSGVEMNKAPYTAFKNNGLFVIPAHGPNAGKALQVASAPSDAELTGPCFSEDERTLFLSVQHPGETTKDLANPTSHWPDGQGKIPRPSVVAITGPGLWSFTQPTA